jgi:hypothetical protein
MTDGVLEYGRLEVWRFKMHYSITPSLQYPDLTQVLTVNSFMVIYHYQILAQRGLL